MPDRIINNDVRDSQRTTYFLDRSNFKPKVSKYNFSQYIPSEAKPIKDDNNHFVRLLGGSEPIPNVDQRWKLFNQTWGSQQSKIDNLLETSNIEVLDSIESFIMEEWENDQDSRIPTAIVLPGSNIANHLRLFTQIIQRVQNVQNKTFMVSISSKECPNLKTALKLIVHRLTEHKDRNGKGNGYVDEDEDIDVDVGDAGEGDVDEMDVVMNDDLDTDVNASTSGAATSGNPQNESNDIRYDRRLRYDFDILSQWCNRQVKDGLVDSLSNLRIIVSVQDADSFPVSILTGLIEMMQSYISIIPLKLMLSVATSLEVFQEKLSRKYIRMLKGRAFQAEMSEGIMKILSETLFTYNNSTLLLSPDLFNSLVHRQKQSLESIDTFISSLKYIFMAHYYSNPFSVLTSSEDTTSIDKYITPTHLKALRMLPSFKSFIERKVQQQEYSEVIKLLEDDKYLKSIIHMSLQDFKEYARNILSTINIIISLQKYLQYEERGEFQNIMNLYPSALSGNLLKLQDNNGKSFVENILEQIRSSDDSNLLSIISELEIISFNDKEGIAAEIFSDFQEKCHDPKTKDYTMTNNLADTFEEYFKASLIPYKDMLLYEVFLSDLANLQESVFFPSYRGALELGLSNPKHYWGDITPSTAQSPHISILYELYRESSVFINIYDYYSVFKDQLTRPEGLTDEQWDHKSVCWFLQGIAELKFLGIIRDCKRKFECLEKIAWKDL